MKGTEGNDVLESGHDVGERRWTRPATIAIAVVLAVTTAAAAVSAWLARDPTSTELSIVEVTVIGQSRVTIEAEPPLGALATPSGTSLPAVDMSVRVGGDPGRAVEVSDDTTDSIAHVSDIQPTMIPAGGFVDIDMTIAPVDCAYRSGERDGDLGLLVTAEGGGVLLPPEPRRQLEDALATACGPSGDAPTLTVTSARYGRPPALDSIRLTVDVEADADRLVLTPLDTPGLRGLGSADRRQGLDIPLLWLLTTDGNDGTPTAAIQVYVIRDSTAYPWIVEIPLTDELPPWVPGG